MAKLHFYYSAMNAGKSTMLLQSSHNYQERGMDTLLFAPSVTNQSQWSEYALIQSRIGLNKQAIPFHADTNLFLSIAQYIGNNANLKCVLIDEAQFLNKSQVYELCNVTDDLNLPVLAYGIRTDFQGEPFEGSLYLLAWADLLIEIKTICHCGQKATMNIRVDESGHPVHEGQQIEIGGNERYIAMCRKHFKEALGH